MLSAMALFLLLLRVREMKTDTSTNAKAMPSKYLKYIINFQTDRHFLQQPRTTTMVVGVTLPLRKIPEKTGVAELTTKVVTTTLVVGAIGRGGDFLDAC